MFQLIVAVIAIALVIALTLASIFYGGEAFTRSSLKANVAAMVNQAQQISGANTLYKTDKAKDAGSVADLAAKDATGFSYLEEVPNAPRIVADDADTDNGKAAWELSADKEYVQIALPTEGLAEIEQAVSDNGVGSVNTDGDEPLFQFPL